MCRALRTFAAILLLAGLATAQANPALSAYAELFLRGQAALDRGDLDQAEGDLQRAFEFEPASVPCAYALTSVAARSGDTEEALSRLNHAVDLGFLDADLARWDSDLAILRGNPNFRAGLAMMESQPEGEEFYLRAYDASEQLGIRQMGAGLREGEIFLLLNDFSLHLFDLEQHGLREIQLDTPCKPLDIPRFSRDGSRAITFQENDAQLWAVEDGDSWRLLERIRRGSGNHNFLTVDRWLSPDGITFACAWNLGKDVEVRSLEDGRLIERIELEDHVLTSFAWEPNGNAWLAGTTHSVVLVHRVGENRTTRFETPSSLRWRSEGQSPWCSRVALSPDGSRLAVGSGDGGLFILAYPGFEYLHTLLPFDDWTSIDELHFDRAGERLLASRSTGGTSFVWKTMDWCLLWSQGDLFGNGSLHHSRWDCTESRVLAYGQGPWKARVLDANTGEDLTSLKNEGVWQILDAGDDFPLVARAHSLTPRRSNLLALGKERHDPTLRIFFSRDSSTSTAEALVIAPPAYYSGAAQRASEFFLATPTGKTSLREFETELLDPKRVRASAAGIRLRRPSLPFDR